MTSLTQVMKTLKRRLEIYKNNAKNNNTCVSSTGYFQTHSLHLSLTFKCEIQSNCCQIMCIEISIVQHVKKAHMQIPSKHTEYIAHTVSHKDATLCHHPQHSLYTVTFAFASEIFTVFGSKVKYFGFAFLDWELPQSEGGAYPPCAPTLSLDTEMTSLPVWWWSRRPYGPAATLESALKSLQPQGLCEGKWNSSTYAYSFSSGE